MDTLRVIVALLGIAITLGALWLTAWVTAKEVKFTLFLVIVFGCISSIGLLLVYASLTNNLSIAIS